jgi:4-amino-4-deoxy-L-arabinose transferase-like glycosyltransferase
LKPQPLPAVPSAQPGVRSRRHDWRLLLRLAAIITATGAVAWWPRMNGGYGAAFWLWAAAVAGYALSFRGAERRSMRPGVLVCAALLVIVGLAARLRFPALEDIPANISIDEILPSVEAQHIAQGETPNVFSTTGWFDMPNLTFAFPALVIKAVGHDPFLAVRLSSALMGLAGIVSVFLLARRLFGDRVGLVASFLMAVAFWHIHNSRTAFPFIQSSFCTALAIYLLVRARQDRSRAMFAIGGVVLGLALQCYFPVRILIMLCPLFFVVDGLRYDVPMRTMVSDAACFVAGALLALSPLLVWTPWDVIAGHSRDVLITHPAVLGELSRRYHVSGLPAVFGRNLKEAAAMFTEWADVCVLNRSPAGLLDVGTLAALVIGVLVAVLGGDLPALLLVAWAALTLVFGVAFGDWPRASYRLAAAMPALFILAAYGIERCFLAIRPPWRWYRLVVRPTLIAVIAVWVLMQNYYLFFVDYAARGDGSETADGAARRLLSAHCDGRQFYFVGDWVGMNIVPEEPPALDLFCPQHQAVAAEQIPQVVANLQPATFLVTPADIRIVGALLRCYPAARVSAHRRKDGRLLFTTVDVAGSDLMAGRPCVIGSNERPLVLTPPAAH